MGCSQLELFWRCLLADGRLEPTTTHSSAAVSRRHAENCTMNALRFLIIHEWGELVTTPACDPGDAAKQWGRKYHRGANRNLGLLRTVLRKADAGAIEVRIQVDGTRQRGDNRQL